MMDDASPLYFLQVTSVPETIFEGDTVTFTCGAVSNPPVGAPLFYT
jgi:hypothetical protein